MVIEAESLGLIADHPNKLHGLRVQGTSLPWYLLICQPCLSLSMSGLCSSRARRLLTVFLGWLENLRFLHRNGHPWFQRFWVFLGLPTGFLRTQPWRCFLPAFARNLCPHLWGPSFSFAAPKLWNNLLVNIRTIHMSPLDSFKIKRKTHLFQDAFL